MRVVFIVLMVGLVQIHSEYSAHATLPAPGKSPPQHKVLSPWVRQHAEGKLFRFKDKRFDPGSVVNISADDRERLPSSFCGIFVGIKPGKTGILNGKDPELVFDLGRGSIVAIPASRIQAISHSSERITPSSQPQDSRHPLTTQRSTGSDKEPAIRDTSSDRRPLRTTAGAFVAGTYRLGRLAGGLSISALKYTHQHLPAFVNYKKETTAILAFKTLDALPASAPSSPPDASRKIGPYELLSHQNGFRAFMRRDKKHGDSQFPEKVARALEVLDIVKRYLESIGAPPLDDDTLVLVAERPGFFLGVKPFARPDLSTIYTTTENGSRRPQSNAEYPWNRYSLSPRDTRQDMASDSIVYGHELTHVVVNNALDKADLPNHDGLRGLIAEAISDYFPASALDVDSPCLSANWIGDLPLREGVERAYEPGYYPEHLNVNSIAQIKRDAHRSSQLLLRFLWQARATLGREVLDPRIVAAIAHTPQTQMIVRRWGHHPKKRQGKMMRQVFTNREDSYAFVAALVNAFRKNPPVRTPDSADLLIQLADSGFDMPGQTIDSIVRAAASIAD